MVARATYRGQYLKGLDSPERVAGEGTITDWHHLAYVVDSVGQRFFVDGQVVSATYARGGTLTRVFFAQTASGTSRYRVGSTETASETFDGVIDDFRIYPIALTPDQIRMAMTDNTCGTPIPGPTPSQQPTATVTQPATASPTATRSATPTFSVTQPANLTPTPTFSQRATATATWTLTAAATASVPPTMTATAAASATRTPTSPPPATGTATPTPTRSVVAPTATATATATARPTATVSSGDPTGGLPVVFVFRQIPDSGSTYWSVPKDLPGVGPYSRFRVASPRKLQVREANGTIRTLIDGSTPTASSLNPIDVSGPDVAYDGTSIVFAGLPQGSYNRGPVNNPSAWRLFSIRLDGSGLRQITFSDQNCEKTALCLGSVIRAPCSVGFFNGLLSGHCGPAASRQDP